jgi:hypothetical protein
MCHKYLAGSRSQLEPVTGSQVALLSGVRILPRVQIQFDAKTVEKSDMLKMGTNGKSGRIV